MSGAALEIHNLSKAYPVGFLARGRRPALVDLSLRVEPGEIFGYLGPNGSGKTTTLKALLGLVRPDAGTASVLGRPLADPSWRREVGYLPEHPYFYDYLTPREYMDYAGRLFGMPAPARSARSRELLERVGLARFADMQLRRFSKGMTQRLGLAQALLNDPQLVFLDEPMSGLDPIGRRLARDLIRELRERGRTVFFSTHILSDAETLCDRVGLVRAGCLLKAGRLDEILALDVTHMEAFVSGVGEQAVARLPGVLRREALGERWRLELAEASLVAALAGVEQAGGRILAVQPVRQSLEDYFFKEMGEQEAQRWDLAD